MAISTNLIKSFQLSALTTALALAGCGGGGGNDTIQPKIPSKSATAITQPVALSDIILLDNNGSNTTTITSAGIAAKIKVTDTKGNPITNGLVTFTGEGIKFSTTNGAILTDSNGIATIGVFPTDFNTSGAYSMTASVVAEGKTVTSAPVNYQIKSPIINLFGLTSDKTSLEDAKDSANLSVKVQDGNTGTALAGVTVELAASCGTISNTTTSNSLGVVTAKYMPTDECVGKIVNITATNGAVTQSTMLSVAASKVQKSQIVYTTTGTTVLAPIYSTSNASVTSKDVQFNLFDSKGLPVSGSVVVSLIDAPSDFAFAATSDPSSTDTVTPSRTPIILTTDSNGVLKVRLYPGTAAGNVTLKATLVSDPTVSTTSSNILVTNNLPSQDNFTFTSDNNTLAANGTTKLHISLKNAQNVPVANSTVYFTAESGSVDAICNTDTAGNCTVNYTTAMTAPKDKKVTILAYVKDGLEGKDQLGSLFRDDNNDNLFAPNTDGFLMSNTPIESSVTCAKSTESVPNIANTCNKSAYAVLRRQITITTDF